MLGRTGRTRLPMPRAAVVTLSFNRVRYLARVIECFRKATAGEDHEWIVVDNGSTDGSVPFLRETLGRGEISRLILLDRNRGISAGYNIGFAMAAPGTGLRIKLDADILVLSRGWLAAYQRVFTRRADVGALALHQINHRMMRKWMHGSRIESVDGVDLWSWDAWICGSACMAVPQAVFERLGHFNEETHFDDADFYYRLRASGLAAYYTASWVALHWSALDRTVYREYRTSKASMFQRHLPHLYALRDAYATGARPTRVWYPRYADLWARYRGQRLVTLDGDAVPGGPLPP
jgi:GT2 family glycosyltransferase